MNRKKIFWIIFGCVAIVHLAGIGLTTLSPARPNFQPIKKQHVVVKTIALNPSSPSKQISAPPKNTAPVASTAPAPTPQVKAATPIAKTTPPPSPPVKTPPPKAAAPKPTPIVKTAIPPTAPKTPVKNTPKETQNVSTVSPEKKALLAKAQASLAKIGSPPPASAPKTTPSYQDLTIELGQIALGEGNLGASDYPSIVVGHIQSSLTLPEHGTVELTLKLNKSGKVEKVSILKSASKKNKTYVENQLTKLHFPPFVGINAEEISLDFTLINAK